MTRTSAPEKEISVRLVKSSHLYEPYYVGGGQLPDELSGMFTAEDLALTAIHKYLDSFSTVTPEVIEKESKGLIDKVKESLN